MVQGIPWKNCLFFRMAAISNCVRWDWSQRLPQVAILKRAFLFHCSQWDFCSSLPAGSLGHHHLHKSILASCSLRTMGEGGHFERGQFFLSVSEDFYAPASAARWIFSYEKMAINYKYLFSKATCCNRSAQQRRCACFGARAGKGEIYDIGENVRVCGRADVRM